MRKHIVAIMVVSVVISSLLLSFGLSSRSSPTALAAPGRAAPIVTAIEPNEAPNDLDITVVISGTGFKDTPTVYLGETALTDINWVSDTELSASVPWGMYPGVYSLTVENPDGETDILADAFTVTQGIGVWTSGGPYGGWVESLVLGDVGGEIIYALAKNVGVFRSKDGGANWELIFMEIGHENRLEVDPTNPNRLYISKIVPDKVGLYESEDGGNTWVLLPKPLLDKDIPTFRAFVNPYNGHLFGALSGGPDQTLGLFRFDRTKQTWIRLEEKGLLDETTSVTAVGFYLKEPGTMYAGLAGGTVAQSTDGGETWFSLGQTPLDYIKELVVNPLNGEPWVCSPGEVEPGGLYKFDGSKWVSMFTTKYQYTSVRNIVFDSEAEDVHSQNIWIAAVHDELQKSEDGGQSWFSLGEGQAEGVALNPLNPLTIYTSRPEGIFKTNDSGANWEPIIEGLTGVVPSTLGANPHNPANVYGAFVGTYGSANGGETWKQLPAKCGGPFAFSPINPQQVVIGCQNNVVNIADDGEDFDRIITISLPPELKEEYFSAHVTSIISRPEMNEEYNSAHITSIITRPDMWLMGVGFMDVRLPYYNWDIGGVYISKNGEEWEWVGEIQTGPVMSVAFDPQDTSILYAATEGSASYNGSFLRSFDNGQTWEKSSFGFPSGIGGLIAIEPTPPYRIYLASAGLWVSSDQGSSWSEANGPPVMYIRQMLFLKGSPSVLYAATSTGLYRSLDGAQTWQQAQGNLGKFEIWSLAGVATEDGRHIVYAATIGGVEEVVDEFKEQGIRATQEVLVNAGVYRLTTVFSEPVFNIYLPFIGQ